MTIPSRGADGPACADAPHRKPGGSRPRCGPPPMRAATSTHFQDRRPEGLWRLGGAGLPGLNRKRRMFTRRFYLAGRAPAFCEGTAAFSTKNGSLVEKQLAKAYFLPCAMRLSRGLSNTVSPPRGKRCPPGQNTSKGG